MINNLFKRVITSAVLLFILFGSLIYQKYLWIIILSIASIIVFIEFSNIIKKIWKSNIYKVYFAYIISFLYLIFFILSTYSYSKTLEDIVFVLSICIFSDIGGYVVGKTIGGKKLTKISPNKTISGIIGSFIFSLIPLIFLSMISFKNLQLNFIDEILFTLFISFICQTGDLFISFFKRKAEVKDTGTILPGHGGLLDRIDGILFALPITFILDKFFF